MPEATLHLLKAAIEDPWTTCMKEGRFEEAWKISTEVLESRKGISCWHLPRHEQYCWNGNTLEKKIVLVRCYHGLGDTLQFIRYIPLLQKIAKEVHVWVQPSLIPLLKKMESGKLIPLHDGNVDVDFEEEIEIMELPHYFGTTIETIPNGVPYIPVQPMEITNAEGFPKIGLVWKSGDWDPRRSVPFSTLKKIIEKHKATFFILQGEAVKAGWDTSTGKYLGEQDLLSYARLIKSLDLLITVDSMPAHLAGALGIPVWTLLHAHADWRWMKERTDSPWYPSMKLFRQKDAGHWEVPLRQISLELKKWISHHSKEI